MALWKDVAGYEGLYLVSDEGEVVSLPRKIHNACGEVIAVRKARKIKPHLRGRNNLYYPAVTLTKDGESKAYSIHRLVAIAFIPNPDNLPEVNHKDENPLNCRVDNLEWCTRQYNIDYSKALKVAQFFDGEKIAEYKSISYASLITGISRTAINNALTGWSKTAGGCEWQYCD